MRLRRFAKGTKVERLRRQVKAVAGTLERNIEFVGIKRDAVDFSPKDAGAIAAFLAGKEHKRQAPLTSLAKQFRTRA